MLQRTRRALISSLGLTLLLGCNAALSAQTAPAAATLTQQERQKAVDYLEKTRQDFLASIAGLSEAQWKYKPAPDRWSVAEVAEHVALSEDTLFGLIQGPVLQAPPAPADSEKVADERVIEMITDRSGKAQAPEMLKPTNKWATQAELVQAFEASRAKTLDFVKTTEEDLRGHSYANPALKSLDAYQWILFLAAHSARHTAQIEEVKADPGFPKS